VYRIGPVAAVLLALTLRNVKIGGSALHYIEDEEGHLASSVGYDGRWQKGL
jgi:hypothetical protein